MDQEGTRRTYITNVYRTYTYVDFELFLFLLSF